MSDFPPNEIVVDIRFTVYHTDWEQFLAHLDDARANTVPFRFEII